MLLNLVVCVVLAQKAFSDEEDPLQHVAQVAVRERKLSEILSLLEKQNQRENYTFGAQTFDETLHSKACRHTVLDLNVAPAQLKQFEEGVVAVLRVANLLNNMFLSIPPDNPAIGSYPPRVFFALVRASLEAEPDLVSVGVAFLRGEFYPVFDSAEVGINARPFAAYSYRKDGQVHTEDLSALFNHSYDHSDQEGTQWFAHISYRQPLRPIESYSDGTKTTSTMTVTRKEDGSWFSSPIFDCGASEQWVLTYSLPFFGRMNDGQSAKLKGVVLATFPLSKIDINQCDESIDLIEHHIFGGTHKCDSASTECIAVSGMGFIRGGYQCKCRSTHYLPSSQDHIFNGTLIENDFNIYKTKSLRFRCLPCPKGCPDCSGSQVCTVQYDSLARLVPLCLQATIVLFCVILAFTVFKLRRSKIIATSLWTVLEVTLLGAIILYSSIFLRYPKPTVLLCLAEPSVRELGFALFYGAIVLKLYRNLVEYRTRKAHRYVIKNRDLMRYLAGLIIFIIAYLSAWLAFMSQLANEGYPILERGRTTQGLPFYVCRSFWWEYVTELGELLFALFGLYFCWQLRKAGRDTRDLNELRERRAMNIALIMEFVFSCCLYIAKHILILKTHPDFVFLAYFVRTHLTVSLSIMFIILPKLWCVGGGFASRDVSRRAASSSGGVQELRLCEAFANGELDTANISQLDPEEIRSELKRVYTQLEEMKSRTMRKDNPHISKRRGGRKPTHRRFSLQSRKDYKEKLNVKKHRHYYFDNFDETKTPEESVCSVEGPSVLSVYADGPSTYSEMGTPSIFHRSFKLN